MAVDISKVVVKPLTSQHQRGAFLCTESKIQNYCINNARKQNDLYMVRVFVACESDSLEVLGYYYLCLSSYTVSAIGEAAQKFNRVDAVPVVYLGMIGVHSKCARMGIGKLLMRDAMIRTTEIAEHAGTYALTLDALNEELVDYYGMFGFVSFEGGKGLEMYLPLMTIKNALSAG